MEDSVYILYDYKTCDFHELKLCLFWKNIVQQQKQQIKRTFDGRSAKAKPFTFEHCITTSSHAVIWRTEPIRKLNGFVR